MVYYIDDELEYELILKPSFENNKSDFNKTDEKEARVCSNFI